MFNLFERLKEVIREYDAGLRSGRKRRIRSDAALSADVLEQRNLLSARLLQDINRQLTSRGTSPADFIDVGGTIFFTATKTGYGEELWRTDGTEAGTTMVKDIHSGANGSSILYLTNVNGTLYFSAIDGNSQYNTSNAELWRSDGTPAGTVKVPVAAGNRLLNPRLLTNFNGTLYFSATDNVNGSTLWKTDGTSAGTVLIKRFQTGTNALFPTNLVVVSGVLYFTASDGLTGRELWRSDGSTDGTYLLKDIEPGATESAPDRLTNIGGQLYFPHGPVVPGGSSGRVMAQVPGLRSSETLQWAMLALIRCR